MCKSTMGSRVVTVWWQEAGAEGKGVECLFPLPQDKAPATAPAAPPKVQGSKDDLFGTETGKARK